MGITDYEKEQIAVILKKMPNDDIYSLEKTITHGMITHSTDSPSSEKDAINCILNYTQKSVELLSRKKLKKEYLFQYLHEQDVSISGNANKSELIKNCLDYWSSKTGIVNQDYDMENVCEEDSREDSENSDIIENDKLKEMGKKFTHWFYNILDNVNDKAIFHPEIFWPDCVARLQLSPQFFDIKCVNNASNVYELFRLIVSKGVTFVPNNFFNNTFCSMNKFGLVKVITSGSLHKEGSPIGTFQNMFGLICDSSDNSKWKTKCIEMHFNLFREEFCNIFKEIIVPPQNLHSICSEMDFE